MVIFLRDSTGIQALFRFLSVLINNWVLLIGVLYILSYKLAILCESGG
jgi:hypothetical protein